MDRKNLDGWIFIGAIILFIVCLLLSLFCGHNQLGFEDLYDLLSGKDTTNTLILGLLRLPMAIKAIVAGTCLALAGMFLQTITKNPLVEPYITGVSSGAGLAIVISIMLNLPPFFYSVFGFLGAVISSLIVISLTGFKKFSLVKLILIGLSLNIFASSLISTIILFNREKTHAMLMVLAGSLNNTIVILKPMIVVFVLALLVCILVLPKLNFMILDFDIVRAIDPKAHYYFIFIVILSALLAAISVSVSGILGFVGIIIPHLSKLLIGQTFKHLFVLNILLGSSILLISDFISRTIIYPSELPLGVVVAIIGIPIFVGLLILRGNKLYA